MVEDKRTCLHKFGKIKKKDKFLKSNSRLKRNLCVFVWLFFLLVSCKCFNNRNIHCTLNFPQQFRKDLDLADATQISLFETPRDIKRFVY